MRIIFTIGLFTNLFLLIFFDLHMFQLNSYSYKKHIKWQKDNLKKIITQIALVAIPFLLIISNKNYANIIAIIILLISILYNIPKNKKKVPLKITNRVKRMLFTETIIIIACILITGKSNIIFVLSIWNISEFLFEIIANFINTPIEYMGRKYYINKAEKILKSMPNLKVIGVTGSYGKTSVKNYLAEILAGKYEVLVTPKNYNTTMGVVKTIREDL